MEAKKLRSAHLYLFYLLAAFPLLKLHWISIVMIALMVTGFVILFIEKDLSFAPDFFLPIASVVFPFILSLPFSDNVPKGVEIIQVKLVLVALPLLYGFRALIPDARRQHTALAVFCVSAVGIMLWGNLQLLMHGFTANPPGAPDYTFLYRISMEEYTGLHPTYYCAILYVAAFIRMYYVLYPDATEPPWMRFAGWAVIVLCVAGGLAAASRATFAGFCLISFIMLVVRFRKHRLRWWMLAGLIAAGCLLMFIPTVQNRLSELNAQNMQAPSGTNDNGTNVRSGIYECNIILLKEHWLWGVGAGDVQEKLNECLSRFDTHVYGIHNYNTHNEYLNSWLTAGLAGFIVFMTSLLYCLYTGWKNGNMLHVYFMLFIFICFFTENYLERQAGVTFYAFLQTLFFMKQAKQE
jgi:O-antigen ligase